MASEETLSYVIEAHDKATAVFRAFSRDSGAAVDAVGGRLRELERSAAGMQRVRMPNLITNEHLASAEAYRTRMKSLEGEITKVGVATKGQAAEMEVLRAKMAQENAMADASTAKFRGLREHGVDYVAAGMVGLSTAFAVEGVKAAMQFDKLTSSIERQTGVSRNEATKLIDVVKRVATETPASYDTITKAVATQYQLFGHNTQAIAKNTDLYIAFANRAQTDVVPAIQAISQVMRLFHPQGMSAVDVMDQLVNLADKTQRPLGDYLQILSRYGPALKDMGVNFKEAIGLFDAFSKAGVAPTLMGRGLATAFGNAEKQIKAATQATQDGGAKLGTYQAAVDAAQTKVNELNTKLATGKGNQQLVNDELKTADLRLQTAKDRLNAYTGAQHGSNLAHETAAQVVGKEMQAIEGAHSKQEALNLAYAAFGTRLGPQMAEALYHNKGALDQMQKSLGDAHSKTENLAKAERDNLSAQLKIVEHDFTNVASVVGNALLPPLKDAAGVVSSLAGDFAKLPKPVQELIVGGTFATGAGLLLSRHTPLGGAIASKVGGPDWLTSLLTGKGGGGGGIWGARGAGMPGSVANPVMVAVEAGGMGAGSIGSLPPTSAASSAERSAARAEQGVAAESAGIATTLRGGLASMAEKLAPIAAVVAAGNALFGKGGGGGPSGSVAQASSSLSMGLVSPQSVRSAMDFGPHVGGTGIIGQAMTLSTPVLGQLQMLKDLGSAPVVGGLLKSLPGIGGLFNSGQVTDQGKAAAVAFSKGFGGAAAPQLKTFVTASIDAAAKSSPEQASKDLQGAGLAVAQQLEAGWNQYKFQSEPIMFKQFVAETKKLPPAAQASAAESAIAFAQKLEQEGRLPAGAAQAMLKQIEAQFPGLATYLGSSAKTAVAVFTASMNLTQAESNLKTSLQRMRNDFPQVSQAMDKAKGDIVSQANATAIALENVVKHGSSPMRKQAEADLADLQQKTNTYFTRMEQQVQAKTQAMASTVGTNTSKIAGAADSAFRSFASSVTSAMNAGSESTAKGTQLIGQALNAELKALGAAPIPLAGLSAGSIIQWQHWFQTGQSGGATGLNSPGAIGSANPGAPGGVPFHHAPGGYIGNPGEKGQDIVPILAGRGEAILNDDHQKVVNGALNAVGIGGLPEVFSKVKSLHYMSQGGFAGLPAFAGGGFTVTASTFGGPADPSTPGNSGAYGADVPGSIARLQSGGQYFSMIAPGSHWFVTAPTGKTVDTTVTDLGSGGPGIGGTPRAIDLWWQTAEALGLGNAWLGEVTIKQGGPGGTPVGGGGAVSWRPIPVPPVQGRGGVADIVRGALKKATDAANAYGQAHVPTVGFGGGAGGPITTAPPPGSSTQSIDSAMTSAAQSIIGLPYTFGGGHAGFSGSPGFDCSGAVSYVLHAGGFTGTTMDTSALAGWGVPGPGKYITVGDTGGTGATAHTMMSFFGRYFESGGSGGGPHWDSGWSMNFPIFRHPPGYSAGGHIGDFGFEPPIELLKTAPWLAKTREFGEYKRHYHPMARANFAGAFGSGGTVTAHNPTMAIFGDNGPETAVFIPHAAGGLVSPHLYTGGTSPSHHHAASSHHHTSTHHAGGGASAHAHTSVPTAGFNPLTGKVETHTAQEWRLIHAQAAQKSAQNKKPSNDPLVIGGMTVGEIAMTAGQAGKMHLPVNQPVKLLGDLKNETAAGFKKLLEALGNWAKSAPLGRVMRAAGTMAYGMTRHGPDAQMFEELRKLTHEQRQLNDRAEKRQRQAERLHTEAMTVHGRQRRELLDKAHLDHLDAKADRHKAHSIGEKIASIDAKIAASRTAQVESALIQAAAKQIASVFSTQQNTFQHSLDVAQALENMPAGTSLRTLGLNKLMLRASGLTPKGARGLLGTSGAPAAFAQQIGLLTSQEIPQYQADAKKLEALYRDALKTHNTKLQAALLNQLDGVTQAILKAYGDLQTAQIGQIDAIVQKYQNQATAQQAGADIVTAIANMAPGTNLAGIGLSPAALRSMGINPQQAASLEGGGAEYIANLQSTQSGSLTPAQIAQASSATQAINARLGQERGSDVTAMNQLESELPKLRGQALTHAQDQIRTLAQSILSLTDTINKNNDAVTKLTAATSANTTATGQMTGTVAFAYNSEYFTGGMGPGMSSDSTANAAVGA